MIKTSPWAPADMWETIDPNFDYSTGTWKPSGLPALREGVWPRYGDSIVTQYINFSERKRPLSNACTAWVTPYTTSRPVCSYRETRLRVTRATTTDGVPYLKDWYFEEGRERMFTGYATHDEVRASEQHLADEKLAYLNCMAGGSTKSENQVTIQLLELKDLGQTIKSVVQFIAFIRKTVKSKGTNLLKLTVKDIAGSYLAVQYGILPTIDSVGYFINDLYKQITEFQSGLARLVDQGHRAGRNGTEAVSVREQLLRGEATLPPSPRPEWASQSFALTRTYSADGTWTGDEHHRQVLAYLNRHTSNYYTVIRDQELMYSRFRLSDVLRLDPVQQLSNLFYEFLSPFENAWAIFPLSFVVDWFVRVDGVAERLDAMARRYTTGLETIDGVWRCTRWKPYYCHDIPTSLVVEPSVEVAEYSDSADGRVPSKLYITQRYTPVGVKPSWEPIGGKWFIRRRVNYSTFDLLVPDIDINLNPSKLLSLGALLA